MFWPTLASIETAFPSNYAKKFSSVAGVLAYLSLHWNSISFKLCEKIFFCCWWTVTISSKKVYFPRSAQLSQSLFPRRKFTSHVKLSCLHHYFFEESLLSRSLNFSEVHSSACSIFNRFEIFIRALWLLGSTRFQEIIALFLSRLTKLTWELTLSRSHVLS